MPTSWILAVTGSWPPSHCAGAVQPPALCPPGPGSPAVLWPGRSGLQLTLSGPCSLPCQVGPGAGLAPG